MKLASVLVFAVSWGLLWFVVIQGCERIEVLEREVDAIDRWIIEVKSRGDE